MPDLRARLKLFSVTAQNVITNLSENHAGPRKRARAGAGQLVLTGIWACQSSAAGGINRNHKMKTAFHLVLIAGLTLAGLQTINAQETTQTNDYHRWWQDRPY